MILSLTFLDQQIPDLQPYTDNFLFFFKCGSFLQLSEPMMTRVAVAFQHSRGEKRKPDVPRGKKAISQPGDVNGYRFQ